MIIQHGNFELFRTFGLKILQRSRQKSLQDAVNLIKVQLTELFLEEGSADASGSRKRDSIKIDIVQAVYSSVLIKVDTRYRSKN